VYPDPLMIAGVGIGASLIALFIRGLAPAAATAPRTRPYAEHRADR
jgi:hypothetical protein